MREPGAPHLGAAFLPGPADPSGQTHHPATPGADFRGSVECGRGKSPPTGYCRPRIPGHRGSQPWVRPMGGAALERAAHPHSGARSATWVYRARAPAAVPRPGANPRERGVLHRSARTACLPGELLERLPDVTTGTPCPAGQFPDGAARKLAIVPPAGSGCRDADPGHAGARPVRAPLVARCPVEDPREGATAHRPAGTARPHGVPGGSLPAWWWPEAGVPGLADPRRGGPAQRQAADEFLLRPERRADGWPPAGAAGSGRR